MSIIMNKRHFLKMAGAMALTGAINPVIASESTTALLPITGDAKPISKAERMNRVAKAQALMKEQGVNAIILEPGAAMDYFTGIQWWRSERLTAVVIPRDGDIGVVCPFFEEPSIRESMQVGDDVRVWQEHESPFAVVADILNDRGVAKGNLGFENSVRYFVLAGVMQQLKNASHVSAEPITRGCRIIKSSHELGLMHKANEVTLKAYEHVYSQIKQGMTQSEVKALMLSAQSQLGGSRGWCLALFNDASAYPHGTSQEQTIKPGSVILMDSGCAVHGYQSDISRTWVFGEASAKQKAVWNTVRKGQDMAFNAAKLGEPAGVVDDTVRQYYTQAGYGPLYQLPGLSHRTGHGIGMEGHESVNFVHGEVEKLRAGMCFSNEPGIYLPGEFGVRLEDCIYLTDAGPKWFTIPPSSLSEPLGKLAPPQW